MLRELDNGKEDLKKRPSLRLQCWNAMCWLGRSKCLISVCRSYEYILEHLAEFALTRTESSKDRELASNLYEKLTSYDVFLFIYMYRDLAGTMARTTLLLQNRDIRIRDVGHWIMNLCERLKGNYPQGSDVPTDVSLALTSAVGRHEISLEKNLKNRKNKATNFHSNTALQRSQVIQIPDTSSPSRIRL